MWAESIRPARWRAARSSGFCRIRRLFAPPRVLQDQAAVRAAEGQAEQGADREPQQAGLEAVAGENVAEAGDGVDAGGNAGQTGGQSAVDHAFDSEVVGEVGAFLGVELTDVLEQGA